MTYVLWSTPSDGYVLLPYGKDRERGWAKLYEFGADDETEAREIADELLARDCGGEP